MFILNNMKDIRMILLHIMSFTQKKPSSSLVIVFFVVKIDMHFKTDAVGLNFILIF